MSLTVIASEARRSMQSGVMDCFAALAMTFFCDQE
jgi:hypothetical protein